MPVPNKRLRNERWAVPTDEITFQPYMARMDAYLAELEMPVPARQLAAIAEVCFDLGESRPVPRDRQPHDDCYTGDDLILRAIQWYDATYGDALKLYPPMPSTVVFLRGEIWMIRFPLITGIAAFYAGDWERGPAVYTTPSGYEVLPTVDRNSHESAPRRFDVLDYLPDLPPGVRSQLQRHELDGVLYVFCKGRLFSQWLTMARRYEFIEAALGDLSASVHHLTQRPPHTGLSKWAGQQALEKILKSYLHHANLPYPKGGKDGHNLQVLAKHVRDHSGLVIDPDLLTEAAAAPAVRYDASGVDRKQAARAHFAAMDLGGQVAAIMLSRFPLDSAP